MKHVPPPPIAFIESALSTLRDVYADLPVGPFTLSSVAHGLGRSGWGRAESLRVELVWLCRHGFLKRGLSQIYTLTPKGFAQAEKLVRKFNRDKASSQKAFA